MNVSVLNQWLRELEAQNAQAQDGQYTMLVAPHVAQAITSDPWIAMVTHNGNRSQRRAEVKRRQRAR